MGGDKNTVPFPLEYDNCFNEGKFPRLILDYFLKLICFGRPFRDGQGVISKVRPNNLISLRY